MGCEDAGALPAGGCVAGWEEVGVVLDAGGLVCGDGVGAIGVVAGAFAGAGLEICCSTEPPPCTTALSVRNTKAMAKS